MNDNYSPNLFLFQSYILEVLKEGKKHIKTQPFDSIDPDAFVNSQKTQNIERYHSYLLSAMGYSKTRQISCLNYQKLVRQGLIDKQKLPMNMISSILTSCSNVGGSTSGSSSLGSVSFSNNNQNQSLYIGNLLKSILLHTYQNTSEIIIGLNYLLQGTRKKYSLLYAGMLEEVYSNFLIKFRQPAIKRFTTNYLNGLLDQIQAYHEQNNYVFASRKQDVLTNKVQMPIYLDKQGFGKFGRCFICKKEATHFMKEQYLPICSFACKDKTNDLLEQCKNPDQFSLLRWILSNLSSGDQIIYSFLYKQLQYHIDRHELKLNNIFSILQSMIQYLGVNNLNRILLISLSLIMINWQSMLPQYENTQENCQKIQKYWKTFYIQILTILQQSIISKDNLDFIYFLKEILKNEQIFMNIFNLYDSQFFQPNILGRMLNILSQYAKKYDAGIQGLHDITKMLVKKYIQKKQLNENWTKLQQITKKKQLKKVIVLFNKKPAHGIKYLKKIFEEKPQINQSKLIIQNKGIEKQKKQEIITSKNQIISQKEIISQKQIIQQQNKNQDNEKNEDKIQNEQKLQKQQKLQQCDNEQFHDPEAIIDQKIDQIIQQYEQKQRQQKKQQNNIIQNSQISQLSSLELSQASIQQNQPKVNKSKLTSKHIALFLRQNADLKPHQQLDNRHPILMPTINQTKLGQYFGSNDPQVREVCQAFLQTLDFEGLQFDDMMRIVLNSFSLPKETQMVQRVIEDIAKRLVGYYQLKNDTQSYQYFYLLLMVQTTNHNPNVRETQKLKIQSFLKMSQSMIGRIPDKAKSDYQRIIQNSINCRMKYSEEDIFNKKYLGDLAKYSQGLFDGKNTSVESKSLLYYIWQYLVIGLIWPGNNKGLFEAIILLGKNGLAAQQKSFFEALRKQGPLNYTRQTILKLGIQYGNELYGDLWKTVISLIYNLQNQNEYNSSISDKLFTNSAKLQPQRLKDFMRSLLQFSKSQIKSDSLYNRQLFVLRNINSLLQYNIPRFNDVSDYLWQLLQLYFKDICLHPRKQISMAAIDSLKQLTLKLLKLREQAVPHDALMDLFVYIFDRSTLQMKDLIANVLLNVITSDLRSGWESLYSILDILDTKDKQLVVRILYRLLRQIGVVRLTNLPRLHSICMKELKVSNESSVIEQLLEILWQISQFLNNSNTWLLTIATIKDIFKMNLKIDLLQIFVRMCNKCIDQIHVYNIEKEIYSQVMDIFIFLVQLKGSHNKKISTLLSSLQALKNLTLQFIVKYIGGSIGFLNIFQLYLGSNMKLPFAIFFKSKFLKQLIPILKRQQNALQFEHLSLWCINQYYDNLPLEVINLKQQDKDFEKTLKSLLQNDATIDKNQDNNQLIEFHLSYRDYNDKNVLHLVFLDIVKIIYSEASKQSKIRQKIIEAVIDSYDCAARINKLILLRNFLWKNGFLFSDKNLPGLHKQQHRTFAFIMQDFPFYKTFPLFSAFLDQYLQTQNNTQKLKEKESNRLKKPVPKGNRKSSNDQKEKQNKNLQFYIRDSLLWLSEAQKSLILGFYMINQDLNKQERQLTNEKDLRKLSSQCLSLLQIRDLKKDLCQSAAQTLKKIYQIIL